MYLMFLCCYSNRWVSLPISYNTLSNPSFTSTWGNYEVYIEPRDIGEINVFNVSARLQAWGFGFSNYYEEHQGFSEKKNWLSIAHHMRLPLSFGINAGLCKIWGITNFYTDIGIWAKKWIDIGVCYTNIPNDDQVLRLGGAYTWNNITGILEFEDSLINNHRIVPHLLMQYTAIFSDFRILAGVGYHPKHAVGRIEIVFRDFIKGIFMFEEVNKALIGINFSPPVVIKEVTIAETLMIEKPVVIKTTKTYPLTSVDLAYCEEHYRKGIEYYVNNKIEEAIKEWKLVRKIYPEYKDVQQYLERAKAKLDLLKP